MKVVSFKPVSIYTHPAITVYEFDRMRGVERLWIAGSVFMIVLMAAGIGFVLMSSHVPNQIAEVKKPMVHETPPPSYSEYVMDIDTTVYPQVRNCWGGPC